MIWFACVWKLGLQYQKSNVDLRKMVILYEILGHSMVIFVEAYTPSVGNLASQKLI